MPEQTETDKETEETQSVSAQDPDSVTVADVAVGVVAGVGLFAGGVLVALLSFSDERLKTDITKVDETEEGLAIYTYRFKGDSRVWRGVLAQEVLAHRPEAVVRAPNGYLMVNYPMLGLTMQQVD